MLILFSITLEIINNSTALSPREEKVKNFNYEIYRLSLSKLKVKDRIFQKTANEKN